ncbi:MAG: hypothetical protein ACRCTK_00775 [Alphaproteobacteria bacterium]
MFFNKKLFLLKLLSVAAVVSEGMALPNLDQDPEDLYSSSLCLSDLRKKLGESNDLLEKSIILANNIMSVRDNPRLHDDLMPAAVEDIKSLFTAQNLSVELEPFLSVRDNILDYAIQQMTPSEGQAICYRSLATHIVLGESSDPKIMELLPMCLHFVELDNSKRELIMRLEKAQRGGIRLTFCNNLFVYLAKRLEGQKNGDAPNNSAYLGSFEDEPEAPPISNFIAPPMENDDDYEVHVHSESEENNDEDLAVAIDANFRENRDITLSEQEQVTQLAKVFNIREEQAKNILEVDCEPDKILGLTETSSKEDKILEKWTNKQPTATPIRAVPRASSNVAVQITLEGRLEGLAKLATSILRDNNPHKYDTQIPGATQKLVALFRETNPEAQLLDWNAAKASFLKYAADVDANLEFVSPELGASAHKTYHGLMTARVDYIEKSTSPALKAATQQLLPISLYFAELTGYPMGLILNSAVQTGSTNSALYNNFFIHSAKALEEQHKETKQLDADFALALSLSEKN